MADPGLELIWSRTHLIPGLLVPHFLSPWTCGPQKFGPPGQMVPKQFGLPGQTVPNRFGPPEQMVPQNFVPIFPNHHSLSPWTNRILKVPFVLGTKLVGNHLSMGTEFWGTICPWGQYWLETVCPEGPINWGPIVGDQMSADHMCLGPNVSQPTLYVT